jgi:hypothetical protein
MPGDLSSLISQIQKSDARKPLKTLRAFLRYQGCVVFSTFTTKFDGNKNPGAGSYRGIVDKFIGASNQPPPFTTSQYRKPDTFCQQQKCPDVRIYARGNAQDYTLSS